MRRTTAWPPQVVRPRPNSTLEFVTGVLAILAPVPLVLAGGGFGAPYGYQFLILVAMSLGQVGAAIAGFLEARRWRLPAAILSTTLCGVLAGAECAAAAFLAPYGASPFIAVSFGLLVLPAALATYLLLEEWLRTLARATAAAPWAVRRVAGRIAAFYAISAAVEGLGFLGLFLQYTGPCAGASGSQTSCSSTRELAAMGAIGLAAVLPIVVTVSLGDLLKQDRIALLRWGPPPTGR